MSPRNRILLVVLAFGLSGCADYMNRRDSITLGAGNTQDANMGIHTVDPFPPAAKNTSISVSGVKTGQAVGRYKTPCDPDVVACTGGGSAAAAPVAQ